MLTGMGLSWALCTQMQGQTVCQHTCKGMLPCSLKKLCSFALSTCSIPVYVELQQEWQSTQSARPPQWELNTSPAI